MIFNKSWENPATATFAVSAYSGIEGLTYVSPWGGGEYPVAVSEGVFTETFRPGEGKLYKLSGNLTRKVLPIQRNPARLNLEIPEAAELVGLDVTFSADTDMKASTLQITTNKRFPEEKTLYLAFDHDPADTAGNNARETLAFPLNGKVRFDPYMGKHIRFTVHDEASWYNNGYAEVRVRYAGEPEVETDNGGVQTASPRYRDVDFTALNEAISAFAELRESDYTPESWREAKGFYAAALDMRNGAYPQNAVTVAAMRLLDSIRDLVPVAWVPTETADAPAKGGLRVDKGILTAAVATLAGTVAGLAVGVVKALKNKRK
jgi:hypothetical protein